MADRSFSLPVEATGCVLTVGTFDGVHRGHHDLLCRMTARARALGVPSVVVTFRPHPLEVVNPGAAPLLLTPGTEQLAALAATDVSYVSIVPFTRTLASYSAEDFVLRVLRDRYRMRELWIGYDHGLGRGREGDVAQLRKLGQRHGFPVEVVEAVSDIDGAPVSSTSIRRAISYGELDRAAESLGRRYGFSGRVVPGSQRGRGLGYPTLNVELHSSRKLLPPPGVYAVFAQTPRGEHGGMMNLGPRPTFGEQVHSLEVHLFGVDGDWYDLDLEVQFIARLRDTVAFPSVDALVEQLGRDAVAARGALTEVQKPLNRTGST